MATIQKSDVAIHGWSNIFEIFPGIGPRRNSLDNEILELCNRNKNPESSELDVVSFLYDIVLQTKAETAIEVGIYRGAGSLSLAQGLAENGGGNIHLVDINSDYLENVNKKIADKNWPVTVHQHLAGKNMVFPPKELPQTQILFIDADHSYEGVQKDIKLYFPLVVSGGFIILHDTFKHEGPRKSIADLFHTGVKTCSLATSQGSGITIIGVGEK